MCQLLEEGLEELKKVRELRYQARVDSFVSFFKPSNWFKSSAPKKKSHEEHLLADTERESITGQEGKGGQGINYTAINTIYRKYKKLEKSIEELEEPDRITP